MLRLLRLLRQLRGWFLIGAVVVGAVLVVGLVHDFGQPDISSGWFTGRPALPAALLIVGYLCMLGQRLGTPTDVE